MPISPFPNRFLHLLAHASTTSGISDAYGLSLTSVQPTPLAHHSYIQSSITATHCTVVFQKTQLTRLQRIQYSLARAVVAAPKSADPDQILKSLHWLKVQERIEYKIISTTYKVLRPVHTTFSISLPSSLPDPLGRRHWSLSFTHKLSRVSKSLTALFGMRHLTYGLEQTSSISSRSLSVGHLRVLSSIARLRLRS